MIFEIHIKRGGRFYWNYSVPSLGLDGVAADRDDVVVTIKSIFQRIAKEGRVQDHQFEKSGFSLCQYSGYRHFVIIDLASFEERKKFLAGFCIFLRHRKGLSIAEMAERLKMRSKNGYFRYESGESRLTIEKLNHILEIIDPGLRIGIFRTSPLS